MNIAVVFGVLSYMGIMLGVGFWASRRIHNLSDFLVAGRRLPFHFALATLFATWFGAGTCMGASGIAYSEGILGVIADPFAAGVALIIAGFFYVGLLRRLELLTVTDIFGMYYGKSSEIFASILMIPVYIGWLGSQMVALGYIVNVLTGIDATTSIIISFVIVLIYTYAGGMWAVTLTDTIHIIVLVLGMFYIFPIVMNGVGGIQSLIDATPRHFWHFYPQTGKYHDWISYAGQWALLGLGTVVGQDLIQRSLSCKSEKVAKHSAVSAGILYLTVGLIPVFLGFAGRLILPDLEDPEFVLPSLAMKFLPPLALVLFVGALISAIMSSADSSLLAASSLTTKNILLAIWPNTDDKTVLRWARTSTLVVAILSMALALYVKQIYNLMVNSWATLFVGIFFPVTAALYWKKANKLAAWISMISGTGTWLGYILIHTGSLQNISDPLFYEAATYGGIMSLLSYIITTLIRYKNIESIIPVIDYKTPTPPYRTNS